MSRVSTRYGHQETGVRDVASAKMDDVEASAGEVEAPRAERTAREKKGGEGDAETRVQGS